MANSIKKYTWSGTHNTNAVFVAPNTLAGREATDLKVKVGNTLLNSNQYSLPVNLGITHVQFNQGFTPNVGDPIRIYRETNHTARLVDFVDGSLLTSETLDLDSNQLFNIAQEAYDKGDEATIGSESFYYSQGDAPTNVAVGTLWYDTSSSTNTLQVWSGTEWQATAPAKVKKTYQRVTTNGFLQVANNAHSSGKTKFADTAFKTHSSLYLNGVKLVEASTLANIPSKGDYFLSGGDVILLNLSSDTDVLVSETFDGSFSSSVTASEANALDYKNQAGQSSTGAAQSASSASDFKDDAEAFASDAQKYSDTAKDTAFTTSTGLANQYSARHFAAHAADASSAALGVVLDANVQRIGMDLGIGSNSKINIVAADIDKVEDVAGIINDVTSVSNLGNELDTIVNKYDGTTNASGTNKNIVQIDTVADNIGDVNTVAADTSKIDTIASDLDTGASSFIKKVSDGMVSVTAVASLVGTALANGITWLANATNQNTLGAVEGKIAEIDAVEAKLTQIDAVAGVADEVAVVGESGYKGNVQTVANTDYKAKVTTVASMQDDVNTVASASSDIDTITTGANLSNIGTVVSNISAVQGASTNAATASTGASTATIKANEASVSEANAETYMNTASGHATTAGTHKTAAQSAQAAAEAAQSIAEGASTSASSSKTQAAASENNAAASAASAQNSASSATASENQAEVYMNASNDWDSFYQKRYLGDASSNPSVDTAGNALENGALYFNTSDNTMYVFNGSTWVAAESTINNVNYGANLASNLNTNNHDISFGAGDKAQFGAGNDLQIYHDGSTSYIDDSGTGNLIIKSEDFYVYGSATLEPKIRAITNAEVGLYHNGSEKLATTSTGIDVTGSVKAIESGDNASIVMRGFNSSTDSGLASLFSGTTRSAFGGLIESGTNGQVVVGVRNNDNSDGFSVVSGGNDPEYMDDNTYDSELFTVRSSGNVGIGTSSPNYLLHIHEPSDTTVRFQITNSNTGSAVGDGFQIIQNGSAQSNKVNLLNYENSALGIWTNNTERLHITASGNVGIGTSSPAGKLEVSSADFDTLYLTRSTAGSATILMKNSSNNGGLIQSMGNGGLSFFSTVSNSSSERLRIDASGNVGIGTTSPSEALEVNGNLAFSGGSDKGIIGPDFRSLNIFANPNSTSEGIKFSTDGGATTEVFIQDGGKVGIGSTNPQDLLHINSDTTDARILLDGHTNFDAELKFAENGSIKYTVGHDAATDSFRIGTTNVDTNPRLVIDSSGNVGIGTTSPDFSLSVGNDSDSFNYVSIRASNTGSAGYLFSDAQDSDVGYVNYNHATNHMGFGANGSEAARIDSSGNLLVGTTSSSSSTAGIKLSSAGTASFVRSGVQPVYVNRLTNDGDLAVFAKDGQPVGSIGTETNSLVIDTPSNGSALILEGSNTSGTTTRLAMSNAGGSEAFRPFNADSDALFDLGSGTRRFKDLYRSGSTYSTSDRNKKQDIRDLTDAEARVAVVAKGSLKAFRYIDTVEAEGDDANIHFGIIAQDLKAAFEAEGLNANNYQVLKTSTYTDDDGVEQTTYSVCYENLLAFIISAI